MAGETSSKCWQVAVPGLPVSQPRQRHRQLPGGVTMNYTPTRHPVNVYKASCQKAWQDAVGEDFSPLAGPIHLSLLFVLPRPASLLWKKKPMPRIWHTSTPDDDNMEKAVRDALNKLAWIDDRQICSKRVMKVIAAGNELSRTMLLVADISSCEPVFSPFPDLPSWKSVAEAK